jgi:hypothetical protein
MSFNDIINALQALAMLGSATFAFLAWVESRKSTAKITQTHELVNSASTSLLQVSKAVAFREGVEHADATTASTLAADLRAAEAVTKKVNGG